MTWIFQACTGWYALDTCMICHEKGSPQAAASPKRFGPNLQPGAKPCQSQPVHPGSLSKKINVCSCLYAAKHKTEQSLPRNTITSILTTGLLIAPNQDKMKGRPTEWEKTLANHISDNGLISKICKEITQFNSKNKSIWPHLKMEMAWIDIFPKTFKWPTGIWNDAQHWLGKCKSKPLRFHLTCVRIAIIKKASHGKCWRGCEEMGSLLHCW